MTRTWQRESVVAPTQADFRFVGLSKPTQTTEAIRMSTHAPGGIVDIAAARNPAAARNQNWHRRMKVKIGEKPQERKMDKYEADSQHVAAEVLGCAHTCGFPICG